MALAVASDKQESMAAVACGGEVDYELKHAFLLLVSKYTTRQHYQIIFQQIRRS